MNIYANIHAEQIGEEVKTVEFEPMPDPRKAPVEPERQEPEKVPEPAPRRKETVPA